MSSIAFSPERAVEAVLFIAKRLETPEMHGVLKLRYFADQLHLSKYGFMASGDTYKAMSHGPVASSTYDLMKIARGDMNDFIDPKYRALVAGAFKIYSRMYIQTLRDPNHDWLAKSERACLEEAIESYGHLDYESRTQLSHDSAWAKAWEKAQTNGVKSWEMPLVDIVSTQANAEELLAYMNS